MTKTIATTAAGALALAALGYFFVAAPIVDRRLNQVTEQPPYDVADSVAALHNELLVADLHNDLLLWGRDPLERHDYGHTDLPRLVEGGVGLQVFAAVTDVPYGRSYAGTGDRVDQIPFLVAAQRWPLRTWTSRFERALYQARKLQQAANQSDRVGLLRTQRDLENHLMRRVDQPDRLGALLAVEGLHALDGDLANLDRLVDAGYRMMSPTHLHDNAVGGSSTGLQKGGLTDFGRRVVERMTERQVLIDLAHASDAVIEEVLAMTDRPVVVSHTGVDATCPSPRNLTDAQIRAVAAQDGVIGIGLWPRATCGETAAATARAMRHVADLVGVEHVALGSDFDGTVDVPFDATGLPLLTAALLEEGFSRSDIRQILGGNVIRLLRQTLPA
jgi:microsomal dipeptidase-like Zn-dependent dipeptidase